MANTKYKKNKRGEFETRIWDGTYNEDGSKHRKYIVSRKSSADLERKVYEFKKAVEEKGSLSFSNARFGDYKKHWLKVAKATREKNTLMMYSNILSKMSDLDDIQMVDLRHTHFQKIINDNIEKPRTCQQIHITFRQIIKMAVRERVLPRTALEDISEGVSMPTYQKPQKRALTALEKQAIQNVVLDDRKMCFLFILYACGLRKGEALGLSRQDFDWDANTVSVSKTLIFAPRPEIKPYPKSKNGIRTIPIPASAVPKIKPFAESAGEGCLFHTRDGELMTTVGYQRMWNSIVTAMNVAVGYNPQAKKNRVKPIKDLTAHVFRHNYCTELCYQIPKISTKMIARLLGDTEKMVLDVYSHIVEEKENVSETLDSVFG